MKTMSMVLFLLATAAVGQSLPVTDPILLPLTPQKVPGGFGSQWETTIAVTNTSDTPLTLNGYQPAAGCQVLCPPPPPIGAHATIFVRNVVACPEVRGVFLFVEHGRSQDLSVTLRSQDISRQSQAWGTTIPVIPIDAAFDQRFGLGDIPVDAGFRSTLRLYALGSPGTAPMAVVSAYAVDPQRDYPTNTAADTLLFQTTMQFIVPTSGGGITSCPAFVEMPLSGVPQLNAQDRIRLEIAPLTPTKYWGLVSVTNNETQEVTIITPLH